MDKDLLNILLPTFKVESAEHIQAITAGLIELEQAQSAEARALVVETIFREAHSMKGAARSVGMNDIEKVCQAMESTLAALKRREIDAGAELLNLMHETVDLLNHLLAVMDAVDQTGDKSRSRDLIARLNAAALAQFPSQQPFLKDEPEELKPPQPDELRSRDPVSPGRRAGTADVMRVSMARLHSLLLQGESFIAVKQTISQQTAELRAITAAVQALRKDWRMASAGILEAMGENPAGGAASLPDKNKSTVLDFFAGYEERITKIAHDLAGLSASAGRELYSIGVLVDGFLDELKAVSMHPFSSLLETMPKIARDLAHDQGKEVRVVIRGGELEIDKRILDELREPLIHLIRNCVDHGIEQPEIRAEQSKNLTGTIGIEVTHREGRSVEVRVWDDGRGIDREAVRNSAVRQGYITHEEAGGSDDRQTLELMFRSGVSTSPIITDISGRGLGLAIVGERVEKLGGAVFCESTFGKGVVFRMLLPLTLATLRGVLVRCGDRSFVIPAAGLERTMRVKTEEITTVENRETLLLDGSAVSYVPLRMALELAEGGNRSDRREYTHVVLLGSREQRIAFGVDEVLSEQEVLVKDLGGLLKRVRNVSGATVLGTGKVAPILNVSDLLKSAVRISATGRPLERSEESLATRKSLLVAEDSITSRTLLKNILEASGYDVQTAMDGMDAWTALKTGAFDLVISDVDMPRMNGFELAAKIRADRQLADMPLILVTSLESRDDRERGVEVGANAYIVKSSFDKSNLLEAVKRLI